MTSIEIPNNVESIGRDAFFYCSGLIKIEIPIGVYRIEEGAFAGCSRLTSIVISSDFLTIEDNAFKNCVNLTTIICRITSPNTDTFNIAASAFVGCENATLYVPKGLVETYRSNKRWNLFKSIVEIESE